MSKARNGSTRRWRRLRELVGARDGDRCRAHEDGWCDRVPGKRKHVCTGRYEHLHHTLGHALTGNDPRHVVTSCSACNLHIGDPTRYIAAASPQPRRVSRW